MIVVHHLNNSRSQRVLWLLEELELPYEIQYYKRGKDKLAPPELKRVHPLGKSPVLVDGDVVVAESAAIMEYILDKYGAGRLRPLESSPERRKYTYWMFYAEGSAMPPLLLRLIFKELVDAKKPFFVQPIVRKIASTVNSLFIAPNLRTHLDFMESELATQSWFAGAQFSAADIMMSFPVEAARHRDTLVERPYLLKFLDTIHARPAYKKALERGGPYDI
jgi:glutathione S-transferase